jgi:NMD protein affecting ribosome stability and mRNA decay
VARGRGIRIGLDRCTVCGAGHDQGEGELCPDCAGAVARGDRTALIARSVEFLSGRCGPHFKKSPDWYRGVAAQSVERRFFGPLKA